MRAADVVIVVRFGWRGGGQDGRKMLSVWKHRALKEGFFTPLAELIVGMGRLMLLHLVCSFECSNA